MKNSTCIFIMFVICTFYSIKDNLDVYEIESTMLFCAYFIVKQLEENKK